MHSNIEREQNMPTGDNLYVGIDLHSNNLVIGMVNSDGHRIKQLRLACEMPAIEKFLRPHRNQIRGIAVESTFNWYWLVDGLQDLEYPVLLANPAAIEQYSGLKHADDKSDAFFLAELLRLGILPTGYIYDRDERPLRDLFRRRMLLVGKRTSLILSLKNLHSRTHGSKLSLSTVKAASPKDVAALFVHPAEKIVAEIEKNHIDALEESITKMERIGLKAALKRKNAIKLMTIAGIGNILGTTILMEIGDIERFPNPESFASYCRTVPSTKSTNGKKKGENNRKSGNRYLAWAFVEAANFCRQKDESAQRWFDRKAARTNKIIATKALACKLAKAAWHILKEGSVYDSDRLFGPKSTRVNQGEPKTLKSVGQPG